MAELTMLALTGAGISKASGIPTFVDMPGIKEKLSVEYRSSHKEDFKATMQAMKEAIKGKQPNAAHKALAKFQVPIITMNIDGLHQKAGSDIVVECHGNMESNTVVLYGERGHYTGAFDLLDVYRAYAEKRGLPKVLLVIGTSMQTMFANEFVNKAMYEGWKIIEINDDAEHKVLQVIQNELEEANYAEHLRRNSFY
jgi:NAD-dependent deacetylase